MIKLLKDNKFIILILLFGLILRLVVINQSLWLDEAIGALAVRDFSYTQIINNFLKSDNHPPLYYLNLKTWTTAFGYSELALRAPSVLYGVLTVFVTYLIARKITKKREQLFPLLSALLLATSQIHIYYSQEARMYVMAAFLASLAVYSFLFLEEKGKRVYFYWVLFSLSITTLVFTDYVPVFLLPVFFVSGLLMKKDKKWWINYALSHLPIVILGIFWLPTFLIQVEKGKWLLAKLPAWQNVAGGANIKQAGLVWAKFVFGRISLINKKIYYALVGLASIPTLGAMYFALKKREYSLSIIWLWLIIPLVLGYLVSFWFPAFIYFRFIYILPAFYIIVAKGASKILHPLKRNLLIFFLLVVNLVGFGIYVADERQQREQWKQAVNFIETSAKPGDIAIFEYPQPFSAYRWYENGIVDAVGVTDSISATSEKTAYITKKAISDKVGVYYFEYLRDLSDPDRVVEATLKENGFEISNIYNFPGVGLIYYFGQNED